MAPRMSARDLKTANDAFHRFNKNVGASNAFHLFNKSWAKVVTKISEALNVLSGQAEVGEEAENGTTQGTRGDISSSISLLKERNKPKWEILRIVWSRDRNIIKIKREKAEKEEKISRLRLDRGDAIAETTSEGGHP
ncbi:hypothetical protein PRIPAC_88053 [Pristionchus pacificus]|uniref:Uncharacterized protein n=1 Tax=Pristionchus pacificus TaxID=54126 RepID=A0A2A6B610_PRIPA|nr:hypothetical protein PRIPAC_88053 [Pristionchus pacificus]|eukprot:PDM61316.1 hypothetical protein PRIPAC_50758 [Pristionchus pacificus]